MVAGSGEIWSRHKGTPWADWHLYIQYVIFDHTWNICSFLFFVLLCPQHIWKTNWTCNSVLYWTEDPILRNFSTSIRQWVFSCLWAIFRKGMACPTYFLMWMMYSWVKWFSFFVDIFLLPFGSLSCKVCSSWGNILLLRTNMGRLGKGITILPPIRDSFFWDCALSSQILQIRFLSRIIIITQTLKYER